MEGCSGDGEWMEGCSGDGEWMEGCSGDGEWMEGCSGNDESMEASHHINRLYAKFNLRTRIYVTRNCFQQIIVY